MSSESKTVIIYAPLIDGKVREFLVHTWMFKTGDWVPANIELAYLDFGEGIYTTPAEESGFLEVVANASSTVKSGDIIGGIRPWKVG